MIKIGFQMGKMGYLMKDFQTTWQIHRKKSRFIHNPYITQNKFQIYQRFKNEITSLLLSHIHLFAIPWTVACQSPLFMGFSRQEYWSGLPFLPPWNLPNPGSNSCLLCFFIAGSSQLSHQESPKIPKNTKNSIK